MKRRLPTWFHLVAAGAVLVGVVTSSGGEDGSRVLKAEAGTQRILREMAAPSGADPASGLEDLKQTYSGRYHELVQQLFLFSLESGSTREGMLPGAVIEALDISKRDITLGVVPLLEAGDVKVGEKARNWLGAVERGGDGDRPDFSTYAAVIQDHGSADVGPLLRYMARRDPEAARPILAKILDEDEVEALLGTSADPESR